MPFPKQYDKALVEQIKVWAALGWSSGMIAQKLGKTRSAIASLCTRMGIKLKGEFTVQSPYGVKGGRPRKLPPELSPDETILEQCLWPDGCQDLRQSWKKPYCKDHNQRAYSPPKGPK